MIHGPNEIPVTYLNKGNIYSISILDTAPTMLGSTSVWYRTSIRISFEDSQHGKKPSTHWNFWMEGRGNDEFQQRGGKMQGVEYVEARVVAEDDTRTRVNLETASIDGFSVLWSRGSGEPANCHIGVRFHFLSTDFSHSKGVKGILSRFCAKTEIVSANSLYYSSEVPEICFCKVNVFRDHGAERKLANDITYVKKSMEKIKQQIVQAETRITVSGKRKRNGSIAEKIMHSRLVKDLEHKKCPTKEDLYVKLQIMQDMLVSTQLVSLLNIRGQQQDDPDLHLVELKDGPLDLTNVNGQWSKFQSIAPSDDLQKANYQQLRSPRDQPIEVQVLQQDSPGTPDRWIRPLQVACFYILYPERQHSATKEYYHAVYIMKREAKGLIARIAPKCNFDPTSILQIVDGNQNRFNIKGDDSAVYELPEGQDMVLNFSRITALPVSREWNKVTDANFNGENARAVEEAIQTEGYLLKLIF